MVQIFDIEMMNDPAVYPHPVAGLSIIETHISWVVLTGDFAYKIKKPVNFGFLDFSTLEKRRNNCEQELRLNRRLAAEIYLDLVTIKSRPGGLLIEGEGEIVDYAVKMRQFPQSAQMDNRLAHGGVRLVDMDSLAHYIASFHQSIPAASVATVYGDQQHIYQPVEQNFIQISENIHTDQHREVLSGLANWSRVMFTTLTPVFVQRKQQGYIRECHGDLHLSNLLCLNHQPIAFDCLEFNSSLRWIDVISDIAFLIMDLQYRQQMPMANRLLNTWLEDIGDYTGLCVLPFYLCYRAMVRAKVNVLRLGQRDISGQKKRAVMADYQSYQQLARSYTEKSRPRLIIMRGLSASGKSTLSQQIVDSLGYIRIRSDVERKRLFHLPMDKNHTAGSVINEGLYSREASIRTYKRLLFLCTQIIAAGYSVVVDAAFLQSAQRRPFEQFARTANVPCRLVETQAPVEVLKQRIMARKNDVSDAGMEVLEYQLAHRQALDKKEQEYCILINTEKLAEKPVAIEQFDF